MMSRNDKGKDHRIGRCFNTGCHCSQYIPSANSLNCDACDHRLEVHNGGQD